MSDPASSVSPASSVGQASSVGVVIRTRDRALFLRRALASVAAQTHSDWHVVLVNDGGALGAVDQALEMLRQTGTPFPAERLTVAHLAHSTGRSAAFNHGLHRLDTDLVGCLDDDDTWHPQFMEHLIAFHGKTRLLAADLGGVMGLLTAIREDIVSASDAASGDDTDDDTEPAAGAARAPATTTATADKPARTDGDIDDEVILPLGEDWLAPAFRRKDFFVNPIAYATYRHDLYPVQWLLDRNKVADIGGFPEDFDVMEDRAFMTRFLQHWRLAVLDKPLAFHHRRVRRTADSGRTVALNTVDNPSYDWRLYADLARMEVHSPPGQAVADALPGLLRGVASTIVKELNDETSALWHKLNAETGFLRERLQAIDNRLSGNATAAALVEEDPARVAFSLWRHIDGRQIGHSLEPATPFLERFTLSQRFSLPGQLVFADAGPQRLEVQLPETRDWSAVEFMLDGLAGPGEGLEIQLILGAAQGYLFETALSVFGRDALGRRKHRFEETHVHSCPDWGTVHVQRRFGPGLLTRAKDPKLSIILPKSAQNFRLICHDLVIMRY